MATFELSRLAGAFAAAFVAGAINSVAGGGSMVSFPTLVALGLPAVVANATNTVGIWPGSLGSMWGFRAELSRVDRRIYWLLAPAIAGGVIGAILLKKTPAAVFDWLVPWLVLGATLLFVVQASVRERLVAMRGLSAESGGAGRGHLWTVVAVAMQLLVGIYGGYFGAGMSIAMLAVLGLMGMTDILEMNAMTSVLSCGINGVAGILFTVAGLVSWPYAAAMVVGSILGGYGAAGVARQIGKTAIRRFVILMGLAIAAAMFWRAM